MAREYPYPPRMMLKARAAHYCDLTVEQFEKEVLAGTLPAPSPLGGEPHWSRKDLDEWTDRLANGGTGDWRSNSNFYRKRHAA